MRETSEFIPSDEAEVVHTLAWDALEVGGVARVIGTDDLARSQDDLKL